MNSFDMFIPRYCDKKCFTFPSHFLIEIELYRIAKGLLRKCHCGKNFLNIWSQHRFSSISVLLSLLLPSSFSLHLPTQLTPIDTEYICSTLYIETLKEDGMGEHIQEEE